MAGLYKQWLVAYNTGFLVHAEGVPAPPGMSTGGKQKKNTQQWKRLAGNVQGKFEMLRLYTVQLDVIL